MLGVLLAAGALVSGQGPEPWRGTYGSYDSHDFHINSSFDGIERGNGQDVVRNSTNVWPGSVRRGRSPRRRPH